VVLGRTGRNFAAGMSGGIAFVHDPDGDFHTRCNREMVDLEKLEEPEDLDLVRGLIERHREYTASTVAENVLSQWPAVAARFVKVMPRDYRRVLQEQLRASQEAGPPTATKGRGNGTKTSKTRAALRPSSPSAASESAKRTGQAHG